MEPITWLLWAGLILPWLVFFFLVDKLKIKTLLSAGILISLITVILDVIGSSLMLWAYPVELVPIFFLFFPIDIAIIPVETMLIAQYMPKGFLRKLGLTFAVAILTVVAETLMEGNTNAIFYFNWKPIYSFPFYVILYFIGYGYYKWLSHPNGYT